MNKKNNYMTGELVLYLCLVLLTFGCLLTGDGRILGFFLMGWAFFSLSYIHKILISRGSMDEVEKPVARLLKGITYSSREKEAYLRESGTRTSIGLLGVGGMLLAVEILYHTTGYKLYQDIAFLCLCGLVFWATQSIVRHVHTAFIILGIFTFCNLFYITDIWSTFMTFTDRSSSYNSYLGGYFLMSVTGYIFIRALYIRRRYHIFAITGLIASASLVCMLCSGATSNLYPVLFALWVIVSVAWTQSRPQSKMRHLIYPQKAYNA